MVSKGPCDCGSSDGKHLYTDGHSYCFVCETHFPEDDDGEAYEARCIQVEAIKKSGMLAVSYEELVVRKITEKTCRRYGYGVSHDGRQVAQFFSDQNVVVAQKTRDAHKNFTVLGDTKAVSTMLYGSHLSSGGGKYLTITEGEIDALSVDQMMDNQWAVVSLPQGSGSAKKAILANLQWVESFKKVRICFDQDEPGRAAALVAAKLLTPGKAQIVNLPDKDANYMLMHGKKAGFMQAWWNAKEWRPDGVLTWEDAFAAVRDEPVLPRIPWNNSAVQDKTRGMPEAGVITIAAGPASGKSTYVHELVHYLADLGYRTGVISLEQTQRETVLGLLTPLAGKPLHLVDDLDLSAYEDAAAKLNGMATIYKHVGRMDAAALEETAIWMAKSDGCTHIILDNLSVVAASEKGAGNKVDIIDDLLNRLVSLTKSTNVTIFLVVHLKRAGEGTGYSSGRVPELEDMRGSGMIEAMSHIVLGLARDQTRDDGKAEIHVLKCRLTGKAGPAGFLKYSRDTGRLVEATEFDEEPDEPKTTQF
jgi:twinkle protein